MSTITLETRRESYQRISSKSEARQQQCIEGLRHLGGSATANELARYLFNLGMTPFFNRNYVHPRLNELVEQGTVKVVGKRRDEETGRTVSIYQLV